MFDNTIFYIVFISQILLVSYYIPNKISNRMKCLLDKYPPKKYPKLYPVSVDANKMGIKLYEVLNRIILIIGVAVLLGIAKWDYSSDKYIDNVIPFIYFIVQFIPVLLMEITGFAYFKLMRKADVRTKKKADLNPRRFYDFVSPSFVGLAIFLNFLAVMLYFYWDGFELLLFNDTMIIFITLLFMNAWFSFVISWKMKGKKLDPYQSSKDRTKEIKLIVISSVTTSIVASLFIIAMGVINEYQLDYFESTLMSIYLQLITLLSLGKILKEQTLENINFDVYKENLGENI